MTSSGDAPSGVRFSVREFARTGRGNFRSELRLADYADAPLDADTLRTVRYLGQLESATMEQLRNLLVTATHKDARVTAFLVTWAFEKFWMADALDAVLEANGRPRAKDEDDGSRRKTFAEAGERRGPISRAIGALRQGTDVVAMHMTTGLVDEWVMRAAYEDLVTNAHSDSLAHTVGIIVDTKKRHEQFFAEAANEGLTDSRRSVAMTRTALGKTAWPVGAINRSADDRAFFERRVFGGEAGAARIADIRRRVAGIHGMDDGVAAAVARRLTP
jgi:hypothetical protein